MATIRVMFLGPMRRPTAARELELEVSAALPLAALLRQLGYRDAELAAFHLRVNGEPRTLAAVISPGDQLELMLPLGGG